jgi:hypothetical protein
VGGGGQRTRYEREPLTETNREDLGLRQRGVSPDRPPKSHGSVQEDVNHNHFCCNFLPFSFLTTTLARYGIKQHRQSRSPSCPIVNWGGGRIGSGSKFLPLSWIPQNMYQGLQYGPMKLVIVVGKRRDLHQPRSLP